MIAGPDPGQAAGEAWQPVPGGPGDEGRGAAHGRQLRVGEVVAKADGSSTEEMQRWMVAMSPGTEVEEIAGADHAVMSSRPRELCDLLLRIANK